MPSMSTSQKGLNLADLAADTSKTANTEWLATDLTIDTGATDMGIILQVVIGLSVENVAEVTFDSGSHWHILNAGAVLVAGALYSFDIPCVEGDLINFRSTSATTDVDRLTCSLRGL